jgi:hypothetical protein
MVVRSTSSIKGNAEQGLSQMISKFWLSQLLA